MPLDPLQVLGPLLGRRVAGVEQVVDRGLDHVQRVAQLVGDAAGDLAERRQPLAALVAGGVLGLVGVLDDGQVEVEQLVERPDRRHEAAAIALATTRPGAAPGRRGAGTGRRWCRPGRGRSRRAASRPASGGRRSRGRSGRRAARGASQQRPLEPVDLRLAAGDDLAGLGVAVDLGVEVVDQGREVGFEQRGEAADPSRVVVGPADVGLEVLVAPDRADPDPSSAGDPKVSRVSRRLARVALPFGDESRRRPGGQRPSTSY